MCITYLYEEFTEKKKEHSRRKLIFKSITNASKFSELSLAMEGQGSSDTEYTVIVSTADSLDSSVIFHVINDVVGFVLYMHQQIPS